MTTLLKMSTIESSDEFMKRWEKFPAFRSAAVSEEAKKQGVFSDDVIKKEDGDTRFLFQLTYSGQSYVRALDNGSRSEHIVGVSALGYLINPRFTREEDLTGFGLRPCLTLLYDSQSVVSKTEEQVKRKAYVHEHFAQGPKGMFGAKSVEGSAPVVTFGGIKYIWLNKEACEEGRAKEMKLISLELVAPSASLGSPDKKDDYGTATELQQQTDEVAFKNASPEELALVVPVSMSSEDGYEKATPAPEKQIAGLIELYKKGTIKIENLIQAIKLAPNKEGVLDGSLYGLLSDIQTKAIEKLYDKDKDAMKVLAAIVRDINDIIDAEKSKQK